MDIDKVITRRLNEIDNQYRQAVRQLEGLNNTIISLQKYASHLIDTGDFSSAPQRLSDEAWRKRASEMIKELIKIDRNNYPSFNSVLVPIYIELRDVYGVVLDQLRKDFRYNNNTLRYPSAFEAISDDDMIRDIFDSLLIGLFPDGYFTDDVLNFIERRENGEVATLDKSAHDVIVEIITPLAIKRGDESQGYSNTFEFVCSHTNCSWGNLKTRYMNKNKVEKPPTKEEIIISNANVLRKFKKTVCALLENDKDL